MRGYLLAGLGRFLVVSDGPGKADFIVVLAGDWRGNRILRGGELVRGGYAPKALVSSPPHHYGMREAELAVPFAVRHGFPPEYFEAIPIAGDSTKEEAAEIVPDLRRRGARKILVVTSDYHTRRARRIWRSAAPDLDVRVVAAPDAYFRPSGWWMSRQGRKVWFLEWAKLVTEPFGL